MRFIVVVFFPGKMYMVLGDGLLPQQDVDNDMMLLLVISRHLTSKEQVWAGNCDGVFWSLEKVGRLWKNKVIVKVSSILWKHDRPQNSQTPHMD